MLILNAHIKKSGNLSYAPRKYAYEKNHVDSRLTWYNVLFSFSMKLKMARI